MKSKEIERILQIITFIPQLPDLLPNELILDEIDCKVQIETVRESLLPKYIYKLLKRILRIFSTVINTQSGFFVGGKKNCFN